MVKGILFFFVNIFIAPILYTPVNFVYVSKKNKVQRQNHPPAVKIITPENISLFTWNSQLNYSISVSDKEDGESEYEEINPKEVLLKVKYVGGISNINAELNKPDQSASPGLIAIRTSNCFNCHNFDSKLIGPSFKEICKRYPAKLPDIELMAKRIRQGSTGVWGKASMPSHPELTKKEIQNMVQWILKNITNPNINYYIGTEGSFRIKKPVGSKQKVACILTASYTDHGLKEDPTQRLTGQDVIIINSR